MCVHYGMYYLSTGGLVVVVVVTFQPNAGLEPISAEERNSLSMLHLQCIARWSI